MWYYCYVLESTIDKTTYIGSTDNLKNRLKEHNSGKTKSIKHKIPMRLIYCEAYRNKTLAIKRERSLKKNSAAKKELFSRIFDE
ncbi:GIY-YIG nuclease family protein [Marivirga salinae]|uniref:GIY-YIG nuclease family protein n=1 Tax=Marivirga salinarum TaxID=3059078 RepID=A0AA49GAI9_9BACT|nr:GIY-YIG nuclease family protein [Marivirga sp. BDSF4-3]WKK74785.2 GIY-YIG nuclease family protein [Marivirga sp. BDSF4-3]